MLKSGLPNRLLQLCYSRGGPVRHESFHLPHLPTAAVTDLGRTRWTSLWSQDYVFIMIGSEQMQLPPWLALSKTKKAWEGCLTSQWWPLETCFHRCSLFSAPQKQDPVSRREFLVGTGAFLSTERQETPRRPLQHQARRCQRTQDSFLRHPRHTHSSNPPSLLVGLHPRRRQSTPSRAGTSMSLTAGSLTWPLSRASRSLLTWTLSAAWSPHKDNSTSGMLQVQTPIPWEVTSFAGPGDLVLNTDSLSSFSFFSLSVSFG